MLSNMMGRLRRVRAEIHDTHCQVRDMQQALERSERMLADVQQKCGEAAQPPEPPAPPVPLPLPPAPLPPLPALAPPAEIVVPPVLTWVPPGHFYSPIVDTAELERRRAVVFDRSAVPAGIDLREDEQLALLRRMQAHYNRLPFRPGPSGDLRYHYDNPNFSYGDAIVLACLLMELRPARFVEIGSGYSSCVTMDVNELFLGGATDITFVEPYPDLLRSLMWPADRARHRIVESPVQDADLAAIDQLRAGDVLFIDSTHVSKCGSDVNFELFTLLPRLASGVYIHFHDIFYPFEYPEVWLFGENRSWNELYILRAFLMDNEKYEIVFFNDFIARRHAAAAASAIPLFAHNSGGSLWLRKR